MKDPCESVKKKSYDQGFSDGVKNSYKTAYDAGQDSGLELARRLFSVKVGDEANKQKITILIEDIDGAISYQFGAAEVIRNHFSSWLEVDSQADLTLYISGTKSMQVPYGTDVQSIKVEVFVPAIQMLVVGDARRSLSGTLSLASGFVVLKGYTQDQKNQAVQEEIYKVLSKYKEKWDKAAPQSSQRPSGC